MMIKNLIKRGNKMKKKLLVAIVVFLIIDQLKMYIHKIAYDNPNNNSIVLATFISSFCLSIIFVFVLGKLFLRKDDNKQ